MKDHPHCYHIDFSQETETCCWCSGCRRLDFGQGYFGHDTGMTTPLLSVWWWRYNAKMYDLYQHIREQSGTPRDAHGPYAIHGSIWVEYTDERPCSGDPPGRQGQAGHSAAPSSTEA